MSAWEVTYRVHHRDGAPYTHRIITWAHSAAEAMEKTARELRPSQPFEVLTAEPITL